MMSSLVIFFGFLMLHGVSKRQTPFFSQIAAQAEHSATDSRVASIRRLAELGDSSAQNTVCGFYHDGHGVPKNYAQAVYWCRKAAEQGNAKAQNNLGLLYENGQGVLKDYAQAASYYRLSAEQGNANAQYNLARLYGRGYVGFIHEANSGHPDYEQAFYWSRMAAQQGLPIAEAALGNMYLMSQGAPPEQENYTLATYWCTKAAEQGNVWAESSLGRFYSRPHEMGYLVEPDYAQALHWYRIAAEQGDGTAQATLSSMYFHGEGVQQDYAESYFWWLVEEAAEQNTGGENQRDDKAQEFYTEREHALASHLSSAELSQVKERVRKWLEGHPSTTSSVQYPR
jgi:uncharacterized protein